MQKGDRYYGSDLNRFVDVHCSRKMVAMNIDLIIYKNKSGKNHIRIIESKHSSEMLGKGQYILLKKLTVLEDIINTLKDYEFGVFVIAGDPPYETTRITRLKDNKSIVVDKEILVKFLNFELSFLELLEINKTLVPVLRHDLP